MKDNLVHRSKHLSLVLRHKPESVGLSLDASGWTSVVALLPAMRMSMEELERVVADNSKKRFEFNADKTRIRACQGHSIDVELELEKRTPPDTLFHGTSQDFYYAIMTGGLQKMQRHHVHLSADRETALIVARRRRSPIILKVDAHLMKDDFVFYLSANGVWLVDQVPIQYLSLVT